MSKSFRRYLLPLLFAVAFPACAGTAAEACLVDDQTWTAPVGLSTVKRVVVVGGGAAGGADATGNFGAGGSNEPNGGATAGTSWGAGGAGGKGAGGGAAGAVVDQSNLPVSATTSVKVGKRGTTAGAAGTQSCFGTTCASGGTGGSAAVDFSPAGGGQAGWGGSNGTSQKTATTQEFGTIYTGQVSAAKAVSVKNNSGASLAISTVTAPSGAVLSSNSCSGTTLAAGASCTFNVALSPSTTGDLSAQVQVQSQRGSLTVPLHATVTYPPTCSLPWGGTISNGSSVTAYANNWVAYGGSCYSQTRTCNNGTLSGSYSYSSCSVQPGASCSLPWGGSISDGSSVTAYAASSVNSPSTCSSQTRYCSNGSLSGSYSYSSCTVTNNGTWSSGYMQAGFCQAYPGYAGGSQKSGPCSPIGSSSSWATNTMPASCPANAPYFNALFAQSCQ